MYVVYCVVLHFNPQLEKWAQTLPVPCKKAAPDEESGLVSYKTLEEEKKHTMYGSSPDKVMNNAEQGKNKCRFSFSFLSCSCSKLKLIQ